MTAYGWLDIQNNFGQVLRKLGGHVKKDLLCKTKTLTIDYSKMSPNSLTVFTKDDLVKGYQRTENNSSGCSLLVRVNFGDAAIDLHSLMSMRLIGLHYSRTDGSTQPSEAR